MRISNMYANYEDKEVKFHDIMLKCKHVLNITRTLRRQWSLTLREKNSPSR